MSITTQLKALDKLVSKGKIIEAFDQYFHNDVTTFSSEKDKTTSKKEKLGLLKDFFSDISAIDQIKFHDHITFGPHSYSKFTFIFTNTQNERLKWHEIIRRKWKGDKVIEEYYYHEKYSKLKARLEKETALSNTKKQKVSSKKKATKKEKSPSSPDESLVLKPLIKEAKKETTSITKAAVKPEKITRKASVAKKTELPKPIAPKKVTTSKEVQTKQTTIPKKINPKTSIPAKATIKPTPNKIVSKRTSTPKAAVAKPIVEKPIMDKPVVSKPAVAKPVSARKPRAKKTPDLTIIEGIGPKIKELLSLSGIKTFAQLAAADVANIRTMLLEKGGTRYNVHDPTTWPEQSALARDGKWDELGKLKEELKGGKR